MLQDPIFTAKRKWVAQKIYTSHSFARRLAHRLARSLHKQEHSNEAPKRW